MKKLLIAVGALALLSACSKPTTTPVEATNEVMANDDTMANSDVLNEAEPRDGVKCNRSARDTQKCPDLP